jgi:hypothetical protein
MMHQRETALFRIGSTMTGDKERNPATARYSIGSTEEIHMLRAGLLWFMGVPLIVVILIWMLYF